MIRILLQPLALALACLLLTTTSYGSRRGQEPRVHIDLGLREAFAGEAYSLALVPEANGFVFLYSMDSQGYVTLLFPVLAEDGRGQVQRGDTLKLDPLYAGSTPGIEQLVAVHTREYRPIKASRHQFLAPDANDLPDIHARLTRQERELDNYDTASLTVLSTQLPEDESVAEESVDYDDNVHVGISVHQHMYDYWCNYCDCWHPACTHNHCWCGWEVVSHYHHHSHYSHCFLWGSWHPWWRPPVLYVYVQGGSRWDYDTRPWRTRRVWSEQRHYSDRWRERSAPEVRDSGRWRELPTRSPNEEPEWINLKKRLDPVPDKDPSDPGSFAAPRRPSVQSTEDKVNPAESLPGGKRSPSVLSTRPPQQDKQESLTKPATEDGKSSKIEKKPTSDRKARVKKAKSDSVKPKPKAEESKSDSGVEKPKPEPKPEAKPEKKVSQEKVIKPAKPAPEKPNRR